MIMALIPAGATNATNKHVQSRALPRQVAVDESHRMLCSEVERFCRENRCAREAVWSLGFCYGVWNPFVYFYCLFLMTPVTKKETEIEQFKVDLHNMFFFLCFT